MRKSNKTYTIRPLEWRPYRFGECSTVPFGEYALERKMYSSRYTAYIGDELLAECEDLEEAKKVASEDYICKVKPLLQEVRKIRTK